MAGINRTTGKATDLITFSRASGGTALRKISYGSELVTNGTFDTDTSGWSAGNAATISFSSGKMRIAFDFLTFGYAYASVTTEVGKVYTYSLQSFFVSGTNDGLYLQKSDDPTSAVNSVGTSAEAAPAGDKSIRFTATATTTYIRVINTGTSRVFDIDNISVKEVLFDQPDGTLTLFNHPTNIPRIEYDAAGNVKGLLIEEARTNLVTYSEAFDNAAWVKNSTTATFNTLTAASDGTFRYTYVARTVNSGETLTLSVWAKANTSSYVWLLGQTSGDCFGLFNLSSGTYLPQPFGTAPDSGSIQAMGDGWYRCSITFTKTTASGTEQIGFGLSDSGTSSVTAGASVYLKYAQLEAGSFPTSYIPTSGATATRAADIASISVDNFGYNQKSGSVVVEASSFGIVSGKTNRFLCLNNNSGAERINLFIEANSDLKMYCADNSVAQATITTGSTASDNAVFNIAGAYKTDDFAASADGNSAVLDTSGTLPTITQIQIGHELGINPLNGHIKSLSYFPRRLTNAQLQSLTE